MQGFKDIATRFKLAIVLRPIADGDLSELTPFPGPPHWDKVDDVTPDGLTTCVRNVGVAAYKTDLYYLSALTGPVRITSVTVYAVCWTEQSLPQYPSYAKIVIKTYDILFWGTEHELPTDQGWQKYSEHYITNPQTGLPWTLDEIAALQIGISLKGISFDTSAHWPACTQTYATVEMAIWEHRDILTRFKLWVQKYKDISSRFKLFVRNYKDISTRFVTVVQGYVDIYTRVKLIAQGFGNGYTRFKLWAQDYKDTLTRFKLNVRNFVDITSRFKLVAQSYKDILTRLRLTAQTFRDIGTRFNLWAPSYTFHHWNINGVAVYDNPYNLSMDSEKVVTPYFQHITTGRIRSSPVGGISSVGSGVHAGGSVTITATPN